MRGLQAVLESFLLDLGDLVCKPICDKEYRTMAPGQLFRPLRQSFQSLVTDLSTGWRDINRSYTCDFKQVDKPRGRSQKKA